jgi:hypothetical protein
MDGKTVTTFRDVARKENRSVAELIREATKDYVARHAGFNKPVASDEKGPAGQ